MVPSVRRCAVFSTRSATWHPKAMEFTIQYFGTFDQMLYVDSVDVKGLDDALERARAVIKQPQDPQPIGYVILDVRGRQVARGYSRRDPSSSA
jgi:hypothetical protein